MSLSTRVIGNAWVLAGELLGIATQIIMIITGFTFVFIDDEGPDDEVGRLLLWCTIGTLYVLVTMIWLNLSVRTRQSDHPIMAMIVDNRLVSWISAIFTFSASLMGLVAAVTLILARGEPDHLAAYELTAVWAMLIAWAIFHWGFARIYHAKFYRARIRTPDAPDALVFPGTPEPRLVDFVYFSFTIGTSFAPSDVAVATTRMRWTVVWHTVFSFFFNALIIVLTMNTIAGT